MMKKRWLAVLTVCAILFSLCACSASGGLKKVLTTGSWTEIMWGESRGDISQFYQNGTGIQYREYEGETEVKMSFRWELSGRILRIRIIDDSGDFNGNGEYVECYEITEYDKYNITLEEIDGRWTVYLRRTSLDD